MAASPDFNLLRTLSQQIRPEDHGLEIDNYEVSRYVDAMTKIFNQDLAISDPIQPKKPKNNNAKSVARTNWQLPPGPFEDATLYAYPGQYNCPAPGCSRVFENEAEFKRHVGIAHLFPYACSRCERKGDMAHYGCLEDIETHLANFHGINGGPSRGARLVVNQEELDALSNSIFDYSAIGTTKE